MTLAREPNAKAVIAELEDLLSHTHYGIERGVQEACLTLQNNGLPFEPTAHATIFRLNLKQFLRTNLDAQVGNLANCGILINVPGYELRVLKSAFDGGPPTPRDSRSLLRFYNQIPEWQPRLPLFSEWYAEFNGQRPPLHLVVHWHVGPSGQFLCAKVACPRSASRNAVSWYFNEFLPNPVLNLVSQPMAETDSNQASDDLGFKPRQLPLTGNESPQRQGDHLVP